MLANTPRLIAVIGATGQQCAGVVSALQDGGRFRVRALARDPARYRGQADEILAADLNRPETLMPAFKGAYGVFAVTNFWEPGGTDEIAQSGAAVRAANEAGIEHFVWSLLPNVEEITGGKYYRPYSGSKAKVDALVSAAGFKHHSFVDAPSFYRISTRMPTSRLGQDDLGSKFPKSHSGHTAHSVEISDLGRIVAGAFAKPGIACTGT
jgi:uncharacterized protein YbjT (DUF2867 family)